MIHQEVHVESMIPGVPLFRPRHGRAVDQSWIPEIVAIRPMYLDQYGNCCHIYTSHRELYWGHTVVQTANDVNRFWVHSHREMAYLYRQYTRRSQSAPLVNRHGKPLVSLKMRHPSGRNDGAMGYVHTGYISRLETLYLPDGEIGTAVHLTTGQSLNVLWTQGQVEDQIERANYIADKLFQQGRFKNSNDNPMQGAVELYIALVKLVQDSSRGRI